MFLLNKQLLFLQKHQAPAPQPTNQPTKIQNQNQNSRPGGNKILL